MLRCCMHLYANRLYAATSANNDPIAIIVEYCRAIRRLDSVFQQLFQLLFAVI